MSENAADVNCWNVHLKGTDMPTRVIDAKPPQVSPNGDFVSFSDESGQVMALFPTNAISGVGRAPANVGTYPIEQAPNGSWLRNVKTDGTGHWVPYTGPLFGVKE